MQLIKHYWFYLNVILCVDNSSLNYRICALGVSSKHHLMFFTLFSLKLKCLQKIISRTGLICCFHITDWYITCYGRSMSSFRLNYWADLLLLYIRFEFHVQNVIAGRGWRGEEKICIRPEKYFTIYIAKSPQKFLEDMFASAATVTCLSPYFQTRATLTNWKSTLFHKIN